MPYALVKRFNTTDFSLGISDTTDNLLYYCCTEFYTTQLATLIKHIIYYCAISKLTFLSFLSYC
jgi:hypothetical protein